MGNRTKGKKRLTIEVTQETIDLLERQVRLYFDTRSKGTVIDELVASVLGQDSDVAGEVYGFCMGRTLDLDAEARGAADAMAADAVRLKAEAFRDIAKAFSTSLVDDRPTSEYKAPASVWGGGAAVEYDSEVRMEDGKFRGVKLSGGRFEIVPGGAVLLNPDEEGKRDYAWAVWACEEGKPCNFGEAGHEGKGIGPVMVYLSDREDLYVFGQHKPARFASDADGADCQAQTGELLMLALDAIEANGGTGGKAFFVAWQKLDMMNPNGRAEVGTSPVFEKK